MMTLDTTIASTHPDATSLAADLETFAPRVAALRPELSSPSGVPSLRVSLLLVDHDEMRELNRAWRLQDRTTDVLSFPLIEDVRAQESLHLTGGQLGDIVICVPYAADLVESGPHRERVLQDLNHPREWTLRDETRFLFLHGWLHLLGYDHGTPREDQQMRALEREYFLALDGPRVDTGRSPV